jgi:FlaA1/EpsC-like NDP-sugar epimerase
MELYPEESFKNNILGTLNVAKAAVKSNVEKFVLISTDKAVNPTSIMGASKRIAELAVKCYAKKHPETKFITVRFGNVLGSQGSVLLTFKKQIEQGGPVTVTHPEMKRYFMTIPEAVQLILEAARMGKGEEIYILNMGEPVKIVDFARQLIRLSGFKPDEDIAIKYTGMRPGEKLFEELWFSYEKPIGTEHPKINKAINNNNKVDWEELELYLDRLLEIANNGSPEELVKRYKALIPEFTPDISIHF